MKRLVILAALVLAAAPAHAQLLRQSCPGPSILCKVLQPPPSNPFALVAHASAVAPSVGANATTTAVNMTGANLLVVTCSWSTATPSMTVVDSSSNTWSTPAKEIVNSAASAKLSVFFLFAPTVSASQTFTCNSAGQATNLAIAVMGFSGAIASPLDQSNSGTVTSASTVQAGSITPTAANELIVVAAGDGHTGTLTIDSGVTIADSQNFVSGLTLAVADGYFFQGAINAINPTWSWTGGATLENAIILSFK